MMSQHMIELMFGRLETMRVFGMQGGGWAVMYRTATGRAVAEPGTGLSNT